MVIVFCRDFCSDRTSRGCCYILLWFAIHRYAVYQQDWGKHLTSISYPGQRKQPEFSECIFGLDVTWERGDRWQTSTHTTQQSSVYNYWVPIFEKALLQSTGYEFQTATVM